MNGVVWRFWRAFNSILGKGRGSNAVFLLGDLIPLSPPLPLPLPRPRPFLSLSLVLKLIGEIPYGELSMGGLSPHTYLTLQLYGIIPNTYLWGSSRERWAGKRSTKVAEHQSMCKTWSNEADDNSHQQSAVSLLHLSKTKTKLHPKFTPTPQLHFARPLADDLECVAAAFGTGYFGDLHFVGLRVATRTWRWWHQILGKKREHSGESGEVRSWEEWANSQKNIRKHENNPWLATSSKPLNDHWRLCQSCCQWSRCNSGCHLPHCNPLRAKHPHLVQPLSQQPPAKVLRSYSGPTKIY